MATDRQSRQQTGDRSQSEMTSSQQGTTDRDTGQRGAQGSYGGQQSQFEGGRGQQGGGAQQSYGRTGQGAGWQDRNPGAQGRGSYYPARESGYGYPAMGGGFGFGPFSLLRQLTDEMDRLFEDFAAPTSYGRGRGMTSGERGMTSLWTPHVEMRERNGRLEVEIDLPGLNREDVEVEVQDDQIVVHGERRDQREQNERGFYVSERSYGSFYRVIPLPDGVDTDQAQAMFNNGVLRIELPLPQQRSRSRQLEIREGSGSSGGSQGASAMSGSSHGSTSGSTGSAGSGAAGTTGDTGSTGTSGTGRA
ncbi:MAG TPA: Hsp20/alpha crystallin family protein [Casimicrobiaceae bacterium]|nr:Hsp20/alpha crystallin family protein [Casimicrobiaceae bacterium]